MATRPQQLGDEGANRFEPVPRNRQGKGGAGLCMPRALLANGGRSGRRMLLLLVCIEGHVQSLGAGDSVCFQLGWRQEVVGGGSRLGALVHRGGAEYLRRVLVPLLPGRLRYNRQPLLAAR